MADHPTRMPKLPPGVPEAFLALLEQVVSFKPAIGRLCGSANAGLMCCQGLYYSCMKVVIERDGWFYKSSAEWEEETCLSRREQETARKALVAKGFLETKLQKVNGAPTLHFRMNFMAILAAHIGAEKAKLESINPASGNGGNEQTDSTEPPNGNGGNVQSDFPEQPNPGMHKTAKTYKESGEYQKTTQETTGRGERPPFPSTLKSFMAEIDPLRTAPDEERFNGVKRAAKSNGLSYQQAQRFLCDHPDWKDWKHLGMLDSQREINFDTPAPAPPPQLIIPEATAARAWQVISERVNRLISPHSFDTWVKPLRGVRLKEGRLMVQVPTVDFKHVGEKFEQQIEQARMLAGVVERLEFLTPEELGAA